MDTIKKINEVLDMIRPYIINDGGDIEFVKYEENIVYIKMNGTCSGCEFADYTVKDVIEQSLKSEIEEIKEVVNVTDL